MLVELPCTSTGQSLQPHAEAEDIVVLNAVSLFKTKDEIKFPVICVSSKKVKKIPFKRLRVAWISALFFSLIEYAFVEIKTPCDVHSSPDISPSRMDVGIKVANVG